MGTTLNRHAYQRLIDEDLEWLLKKPRTLERDHIEGIIKRSLGHEYGVNVERVRRQERTKAFKQAAKLVARLPVRINRHGVKKGSDTNGWSSAINEAVKAIEAAANTEEGAGDG